MGFSKKSVVSNEHTSKFAQVDAAISPRTVPFWSFALIMIWPLEIFVKPLTVIGEAIVFAGCGEIIIMPPSWTCEVIPV